MVGSMYAAISGLKAHQQKMNVIGNNIANVNTYGYKSARTVFRESLYSTLSPSAAGTATMGGVNASQMGYGTQIGTIDMIMTSGTFAPTGVATDMAISGDGFFMVGPKLAPGEIPDPSDLTLTRVGDFKFDEDGYLVDGNGNCVYGFMPRPEGTEGGAIDFKEEEKNPDGSVTVKYQWDTVLQPIRLPIRAEAPDDPNDANAIDEGTALFPNRDENNAIQWPDDNGGTYSEQSERIKVENVQIDENGRITAVNQETKETLIIGVIAVGTVDNPNGLTKLDQGYYTAGAESNAGRVTVGTVGDVVDGYLNNMTPDGNGDDTDLEALSAPGKTKLIAGGLEQGNTDLSTEFADLITTQRGFQANTKMITVTDEMLSELVAMKR